MPVLTLTQYINRIFNPTADSSATFDQDIRLKRTSDEGGVLFEGWNKDLEADPIDATWLIKRTAIFGSETLEEWADVGGVKGAYNGVWASKTAYFPDAPYANTYGLAFFSSANNYVSVAHHADLDFTNTEAFSIAIWVKSVNPTSNETILEKFAAGFGYTLDHDTSGRIQFNFQAGGAGNRIRIREDFHVLSTASLWNFIVVTYDGSGSATGLRLYVNGAETGRNVLNNTLSASPANAANLVFGSNSAGGTPRFSGFMDEPAFYNSVLTSDEVQEIYAAATHIDLTENLGDYVSSGNLISQWRFGDGDTYPTVIDRVSGHNGTMTNMGPGNISVETP